MDHRKERNEFGLDECNEQDVRNESRSEMMVWIFGGLAAFTLFAALAFFTSTPTDTPTANRPTATTTGSGTQR